MTLWVSHWSAPWLVHTTLLIHSSHSLVHTLVTSHVATISSTSSHHLTLSSLVSPCRVSAPISLLLLLRPLLHHLRILLGILTLLLLLLWMKLLLLLLRNTSLLPWGRSSLITSSHLISSKLISCKAWHLVHLSRTSSIVHWTSDITLSIAPDGTSSSWSSTHSILVSHITLSLISSISLSLIANVSRSIVCCPS